MLEVMTIYIRTGTSSNIDGSHLRRISTLNRCEIFPLCTCVANTLCVRSKYAIRDLNRSTTLGNNRI